MNTLKILVRKWIEYNRDLQIGDPVIGYVYRDCEQKGTFVKYSTLKDSDIRGNSCEIDSFIIELPDGEQVNCPLYNAVVEISLGCIKNTKLL